MELALPKRGEPETQVARITKRLRDANFLPIRKASDNHILDTRISDVEYADGKRSALSANLIAENMFAQIDEKENLHVLMDGITYHLFDDTSVKSHNEFVTTSSDVSSNRW